MTKFSLELAVAFTLNVLLLVQSKIHRHDFVLKEKNFTKMCSTRTLMVVNESLPGPVIYVNKGDTLYVNVHNQGNYKVTIHWHGVKQPRNPWFDGPEYITQCAIKPGTNFTYEVIFSDEEGTLWWHAHNEWTRNSVHGAIIIYPEEGKSYPFPKPDSEEIIVLGSWYNVDDLNLVVQKDLETGVNIDDSDAYIINGQPGDFYACSQESTIYRWEVDYGKTYLVRIVNAAMNSQLFFAISEHNVTIVGMDGSYVKPFNSSYIVLAPGNTMDILVTTNQLVGKYYIATRQYYTGSNNYPGFDNTTATAILQYSNSNTSSISFPFDTIPEDKDFDASISFRKNLKSLQHQNVPNNISTSMFITAAVNFFYLNDDQVLSTSLNNVTWMNPLTDVLQAYYNNISGFYTEDFPDMPPTFYNFTGDDYGNEATPPIRGTKVKVLEYGEEVEIIFQTSNIYNESVEHPMHLHGHSFYVVGYGDGNFDFEQDPKTYNLIDPPLVNTVSTPKYGWVTIRFKALNPGVWLWHCHMDRHLSWGMAVILIVKNGESPETSLRKQPTYMPPCDETPPPNLINKEAWTWDELFHISSYS